MEIPAKKIDAFLARPGQGILLILLYGSSSGMVIERAERLWAYYQDTYGSDIDAVFLSAQQIEPGRIMAEFHSPSLFAKARILRIRDITARHASALTPLLDTSPPAGCIGIFQAVDVNKTTALYKNFAACPHAAALGCYEDTIFSMRQLITTILGEAGFTVREDALFMLSERLVADRMIARKTLETLIIYRGQDRSAITISDVSQILGQVDTMRLSKIVDATAGGFDHALQLYRHCRASGVPADMILSAIAVYFLQLQLGQVKIAQGNSATQVARQMGIFFQRQSDFIAALAKWRVENLAIALDQLTDRIAKIRKMPQNSDTLASQTILSLLWLAKSSPRNFLPLHR